MTSVPPVNRPLRNGTRRLGSSPPEAARCGRCILGGGAGDAEAAVRIRRDRRSVLARPSWALGPNQPGHDEVWLDSWQREDLGASPGDHVDVEVFPASTLPAAGEVWLQILRGEARALDSTTLSEFLVARRILLHAAMRLSFVAPGGREPVELRVSRLRAGGVSVPEARILRETELRLVAAGAPEPRPGRTALDEVGGLEKEIRLLLDLVELPLRLRAAAATAVASPPGVLLHGPPGCGKTLLARALASVTMLPMHELTPARLAALPPGGAEQEVASVLDAVSGSRDGAFLLLDEVDALAPAGPESGSRPITALLAARMDGLRARPNVVIVGTSSRPARIDPALRRHGRFSREVEIGAPGAPSRLGILRIHASKMPIAGDSEEARDGVLATVAGRTHGFVGADLVELCREAGLNALRRTVPDAPVPPGDPARRPPLEVGAADFDRALAVVRPSALREVEVSVPDQSFSDVLGMPEVIEELRERVVRPLRHPEVFAAMRLPPQSGILLHGPPGTGKTMLAKAVAHEIDAAFLVVQGPELLSKWVGESEEGVRRVFSRARQMAPCVIFFDEIEALVPVRGSGVGDSGVSDRVVNQFLAEVDGVVSRTGVTVIGATNRPALVDPAALRPGRLGVHVLVPLPDAEGRARILRRYAGEVVTAAGIEEAVRETPGFSGADLAAVCERAAHVALRGVDYARPAAVEDEHLRAALVEFRARRVAAPSSLGFGRRDG